MVASNENNEPYNEELDMRDPNKIAGPDFMDDLRAAMREKAQAAIHANLQQRRQFDKMAHLIQGERLEFQVPQDFLDGLAASEPIDDFILQIITENARIRDAQGYGTILSSSEVIAYFAQTEERKRKLAFLRTKRQELGLPLDNERDPTMEHLMQLESPEELYRLYLAQKIEGDKFNLFGHELKDHYPDTEALEWLAKNRDQLSEFQTRERISIYNYYDFLVNNRSEESRNKLLSAAAQLNFLLGENDELKESIDTAISDLEVYDGLSTSVRYLDAVISATPQEIKETLKLLEKIADQTGGRKRKYTISEFFHLNRFIHDSPELLEVEDWDYGNKQMSRVHPTRLILQKKYSEGIYGNIGTTKYLLEHAPHLGEWSEEMYGYYNLGRLNSLNEGNYFTYLSEFIENLAPLENDELRNLIKIHFELSLERLSKILGNPKIWESPQTLEKLSYLAHYRKNHGEHLSEIDIHLALENDLDKAYLAWICKLRDTKGIQFDALKWMSSYSLSYVDQKIRQLTRWHEDPSTFREAKESGLLSEKLDNRYSEYSSYFCHYQDVKDYGPKRLAEDLQRVKAEFHDFRHRFQSHLPSEPHLQLLELNNYQSSEQIQRFFEPYLLEAIANRDQDPFALIAMLKRLQHHNAVGEDHRDIIKELIETNAENWPRSHPNELIDLQWVYLNLHIQFGSIESAVNSVAELPIKKHLKQDIYLSLLRNEDALNYEGLAQLYEPIAQEAVDNIQENPRYTIKLLTKLLGLRMLKVNYLDVIQETYSKYGDLWEEENPKLKKDLLSLYIEISIQFNDSTDGWGHLFDSLRKLNIGLRERQILFARVMESAISKGEFDALDELSAESEVKAGAYMKAFTEKYATGQKGKTIVVLTASNEYREADSMASLIKNTIESLKRYEPILDQYEGHNIPDDLQASIGMEYEITRSTAKGYSKQTDGRNFKADILRLSGYSGTGKGMDAEHEIATQPTNNPAAMLLEMQLYQELGYFDFNFNGGEYQKGAHGCHLSLGGAHGIEVGWGINFLQNALIMANWAGVNSGKEVTVLSKGRGMNIRQRGSNDHKNIVVFEEATPTVELRCISIDKKEPFERAILASHDAAIAIQAVDKYTMITPEYLETIRMNFPDSQDEFERQLRNASLIKEEPTDARVMPIIYAWTRMNCSIMNAIEEHNQHFLDNETHGYIDENGSLVEVEDFRGEHNKKRFEAVIASLDEDIESYIEKTKLIPENLFQEADTDMSNAMTRVNNLYLKPSLERGGDTVNAMAMLSVTKLDNQTLEESDGKIAEKSIFERGGKRREGYYSLQGGSETMIIHSVQRSILDFQSEMKVILTEEARRAA